MKCFASVKVTKLTYTSYCHREMSARGDGKNSGARSVLFCFFASRCTLMLTMIYINFYVTTSTRSRGPIDGPTGERYFHDVVKGYQ